MNEYLPSFIVEPVLRQARRFSRFNGDEQPLSSAPTSSGIDPLPAHATSATPASVAAGFLPNVPEFQLPDFQRFYPSRFWNNVSPPPTAGDDEPVEGAWTAFARNIQLWANQINNLDVFPTPPLDSMQNAPFHERDRIAAAPTDTLDFPLLDEPDAPLQPRPVRLEDGRTISETSLNPAQELSYRSRVLADVGRGHSQSDPVNNPGGIHIPIDLPGLEVPPPSDSYGRRDGSGQLPEDDGMRPMRQRINAIMAGPGSAMEKSRLIHLLMNEGHMRSQTPSAKSNASDRNVRDRANSPFSTISAKSPQPMFHLTASDLRPTYAPPDVDDDGHFVHPPALGCLHYKRNVKMQCATCDAWYTCRLCHDEAEDHTLPRRDTRYMLCMLCQTPQPVAQVCRSCNEEAACYYCPICKLWNNDPEKSIYHCDDCGICRLGKGLGKDFFHCKTCAACMSIGAEASHKCVEQSTRCDCPICGEYMFTSNQPVAFMRCGHSIHERCFAEWCNTSYKCPICSRSITNMESQFRRLDRHIAEQPMPEEYRHNRVYVFCNDCRSRSITQYHWLGFKCGICEGYNTTQLELLGPEQTPQQIREQNERAAELGLGEAGLTASQTGTPAADLTSPASEGVPIPSRNPSIADRARSPPMQGSPYLLPHSPTRSARSITPVVGSYFGTGQRPAEQRPQDHRRGSYLSIFSAGQPRSPEGPPARDPDEEMDFWGGRSVRSGDEDMELADAHDDESSGGSSSSDEAMPEKDDDDDDDEEDAMSLMGHR